MGLQPIYNWGDLATIINFCWHPLWGTPEFVRPPVFLPACWASVVVNRPMRASRAALEQILGFPWRPSIAICG